MADIQKNRHFDISAAVIRQLGEELVSDEVTAIMELIKNSYDADADWVKVEINTKEYCAEPNQYYKNLSKGFITIKDNGFGMSENDIWDKWMKISLSFKRKFKREGKTTPKGRTPLGDKGLGRLSTQKLGKRLELFTSQENSITTNHVAFDWDQFDDDVALTSVPVHIDSYNDSTTPGTLLIITNLQENNSWEGISKDKFRGQLSQLIFPYKEKRSFNVYLKINGKNYDLDELSKNIRNNSVSNYTFQVKDDTLLLSGKVFLQKLSGSNKKDDIEFYETNILSDFGEDFFNFLVDKSINKQYHLSSINYDPEGGSLFSFKREITISKLDQLSWIDKSKYAHPGNFSGEIFDFYFKESEALEDTFNSLAEFKRIIQNQLGVRIFRDGFGIKPYGLGSNDWLNLSKGQTSGGSFYGLRPSNTVGFISISAKENEELKEKTDREGFMDNLYSKNFQRIIDYLVNEINNTLENTRRSYNEYRKKLGLETGKITDIKDTFETLRKTSSNAKSTQKRAKEVKAKFAAVEVQVQGIQIKNKGQGDNREDEERRSLLKQINLLIAEAKKLFDEVENLLEDAILLDKHVEFLKPQIESLEQQLSDFSELAGLGLTSEALSHELSNIVDRVIEETDRISHILKNKSENQAKHISLYIEQIRSSTRAFSKQLSHLAPSLRYVRETKDAISIKEFLTEIKEYYNLRHKGAIEIIPSFIENDFSLNMNKGKLTQIIDNIILNSEYWLKEKIKSDSSFKAKIFIDAKEPFIRIYDNGFGIDPNFEELIFQPFVTTKPKKLGRGLGLFIVQQLLETERGEILLLSERNSDNRRYKFQLNFKSIIQ